MPGMTHSKKAILLATALVLASSSGGFAKKVVIHWQHDVGTRTAAVRQFAKEFQKLNPDIEVKVQTMDWGTYMDKVLVALAAGSGPNVCQLPSGLLPEYISKKILAPAPVNIITTDYAKQHIHPFINERLIFKSKIYGLPTDVQTMVLYSNKELLSQAGLDPARTPRTWTDLKQYAIKLTKTNSAGKSIQSGFNWGNYSICLEAFMVANGAKIMDDNFTKMLWNTPQSIEAIQYLTEFNTRYKTMDLWGISSGKVAMETNHTVNMGELRRFPKIKYTVSPLPVPDGKPESTIGTHWAYVVPRGAKNADAAWKWVKWLTSKENQIKWFQMTGDLPAFKELVKDPNFKFDENMGNALDTLASGKALSWVGWVEWVQLYDRMVASIVTGKKGIAEALNTATQEGNIILKKKGMYLKDF